MQYFQKNALGTLINFFFTENTWKKNKLTFVRHFPKGINTRGGHVPGERPHPDASPEQRFDGQTQPECALRYSTHGADCLKPVKTNKWKEIILKWSTYY